jgi:hypothetical protein
MIAYEQFLVENKERDDLRNKGVNGRTDRKEVSEGEN